MLKWLKRKFDFIRGTWCSAMHWRMRSVYIDVTQRALGNGHLVTVVHQCPKCNNETTDVYETQNAVFSIIPAAKESKYYA